MWNSSSTWWIHRLRPGHSRSTARRSCSSASSRARSRSPSASSPTRPGCRRARPPGCSPRSSGRDCCSVSTAADGCGRGRFCCGSRNATFPRRTSSSCPRRPCAASRKRAARRSTSASRRRSASSISRSTTAATSSARRTGSGAASRTTRPRTARSSSPSAPHAAIRARGYATAVDELEQGLSALAGPVYGARGDVVAALSISGPTHRLTSERIEHLAPLLLEQCAGLSARLGHHDVERGAA
jgi:hypothetical protein